MTELDAATLAPAAHAPASPPAVDPPRGQQQAPPARTYSRQVLRLTLRRIGARLGLVWIALLVLCAVFAPLLANTHPILMKQGGRWSSPLLRHVAPEDVVLQVSFWSAIVLWF